jgi:hypothetical protein
VVPFIAGVSRMKQRPFILWNLLSAICWSVLNVFAGYFSGALVISIFKKWSSELNLILFTLAIIGVFYWFIKKRGKSIKESFLIGSLNFIKYLSRKEWFNKLVAKYPTIAEFFNESKYPAEKLFGSLIILSLLTSIYILTLILDVF